VLLINSAVAFTLALLIVTTIHEFGHAVAALALGAEPVVHPFSVDVGVSTDHDHLITALTGPVVTLLLGVVVVLLPQWSKGFAGLFQFWLGMLALGNLPSYLMTGPFRNLGDISSALGYAHAPGWVGWLGFLVGIVALAAVGWLATARLITFADPAHELAPQLRALGLFAWLLGAVITLIVSIGAFDYSAVGLFEAFGLVTAGIFIFVVRPYLRRHPEPSVGSHLIQVGWRGALIGAVLVVVVAVLRLVLLGPGLAL
jgi:hypothetical protein